MEYHEGGERRWLDISICHPAAGNASQVTAAAKRNAEAARRGEREKHARYPGAALIPFVVEAGGRLGSEGRSWLKDQARQLPEDTRHAELMRAYKMISCALQMHVARQLRSAAGLR